MKKILQLVVSLTAIAAVCAGVLATVNAVTKNRIAEIRELLAEKAAREVMGDGVANVEKSALADGSTLYVGKDGSGKAVAYALKGKSSQGYGGDIVLMVGFTPNYKIITYRKLEASETPGLGSKLSTPEFMGQFKGLDASSDLAVKKDGGAIEAITSATITSRAVCGAINDARAKLSTHLSAAKNG